MGWITKSKEGFPGKISKIKIMILNDSFLVMCDHILDSVCFDQQEIK